MVNVAFSVYHIYHPMGLNDFVESDYMKSLKVMEYVFEEISRQINVGTFVKL